MATKKILIDLDVEGKILAEQIGIGIDTPVHPFDLVDTNTETTDSKALSIDYTKNQSATTGWNSSAYGIRALLKAEGAGKNNSIQAASFQAVKLDAGETYYLLGSQSKATHSGSGNTGAIWGAYNSVAISGTGTATHPFVIATNQNVNLNNANATVDKLDGILAIVKTEAGVISSSVNAGRFYLDCNQGSATTVDAAVVKIESDMGNLTVSGNARAIDCLSTLPSVFVSSIQAPTFYLGSTSSYIRVNAGDTEIYAEAGLAIESADGMLIEISDVIDISGGGDIVSDSAITATSFTKSGGTSAQFLKADGSVDSTVYAGAYVHPDYVTTNIDTSGATIIDSIATNSTGHITAMGTRTLTLANLGYTGATDANKYIHPTHPGDDMSIDTGALTGAVIVSDIDLNVTTDTLGHVTDANASISTRTLTLANLGYTGATNANNYVHPTHPGDDMAIDTGALTGATVVSDIDLNVTTDTLGHVTDANATIATRTLTLANLGFTGDVDATNDQDLSGYLLNTTDTLTGRLTVTSSVRVGNDTATAVAGNVGAMRYYEDALGSYVDMVMKTDASTYSWVNIVRNIFSV